LSYKKHFYPGWLPKLRDNPEVAVFDNDLNAAIRELKKRVINGAYPRTLKDRNRFPSRSARRKLKAKRAYVRSLRTLNRRYGRASRN
jgi:ribosomal protein S21